ncbi:MAG: tetratricopeptide (TPR) repeat protein [Candidatus Omnitrophota bacterium]|jgi:tetratricopeptide (TPR) repeat protein
MGRIFIVGLGTLIIIMGTTAVYWATQTTENLNRSGLEFMKQEKYHKAIPTLLASYGRYSFDHIIVKAIATAYHEIDRDSSKTTFLNKHFRKLQGQINQPSADVRDWNAMAYIYYDHKMYSQAESLFRYVLEKDLDQEIRWSLGEVLAWQRKYNQAIPLIESLMSENYQTTKLGQFLGDIYMWSERYDLALTIYYKYLEDNSNRDLLFKIGECLRLLGKNDEALKYYNLAEAETKQTVDKL